MDTDHRTDVLIAGAEITDRTRRPLPVAAFDWTRVDPEAGITLKPADGSSLR